ncbi:MAG: hypothetical protein M3Z03_06020 [Actinomycetota bacterium]|nr:hypothetical protein [Actinomycetota bacterium]
MNRTAAGPWTPRARVATAAGLVIGALLVIGGAVGAGSEDNLPDEIKWLNLGVMGVVVGGATVILWLLAGRRAVTTARNRVIVAYAGDLDVAPASPTTVPLSGRVTVAGSTWHHRADCILTAGKPLLEAGRTDGLAPCVVCGG